VKIRWRDILLSLALALLLGLAYRNQAFFFTFLIEPVASILWLAYRTFLAVDQEFYWALLILTASISILRMIPNNPEGSYRLVYRNSIQENDRVAHWGVLLESAEKSKKGRQALQHELEVLHRSTGALIEGNDEEDILLPPFGTGFRQRIRAGWMSFPLSRIIQPKEAHEPTELEKTVDLIVKSMEIQLERPHDRRSNRPDDD